VDGSAAAALTFSDPVGKILCYLVGRMQSDDVQKKARPVLVRKKSEGWREREESKAAGIAPRQLNVKADAHDEHALVGC
jgi:hypothetical protein